MYNPQVMPFVKIKMLAAFRALATTVLACLSFAAHAQLSIEITGAGASRFPVVIPVFENEARLPRGAHQFVAWIGNQRRPGIADQRDRS